MAAPVALAQETAKPPEQSISDDKPAREQTIYIPYAKLRQIFEKEGRGVFVPYDEFQRLWKAAQNAAKKIDDYKPPIAALIAEIESEATVSRDVMTVSAKLQIEVLTEGWHEVPLRLKDAAIRSAKIGDLPARLLYSGGQRLPRALGEKRQAAGKDRADAGIQQSFHASSRGRTALSLMPRRPR